MGDIRLLEAFAIGGNLKTQTIGLWSSSKGIQLSSDTEVWQRRRDLGGVNLHCLIGTYAFASVADLDDDEGRLRNVSGYAVVDSIYLPCEYVLLWSQLKDLQLILQRELNFTSNFSLIPEGKWGALGADGITWNGAVGALVNGEADMISTPLTWNLDRDRVLDYSMPILEEKFTLVTPRLRGNSRMPAWLYVQVFDPTVWLLILATICSLTVGFGVIEALLNRDGQTDFDILQSVALQGVLLVRQDNIPEPPKTVPSRILFLTSLFWASLLYTYYATSITSRLIAVPHGSPIGSFEDVLKHGYSVLVVDSSAIEAVLAIAAEGTAMKQYYDLNMAGNPTAFLSSVEEGKIRAAKESKTLLFDSDLSFSANEDFQPLTTSDGVKTYSGWAFPKDSEFRDLISYHLERLFETGMANRLRKKWTYCASENFDGIEPLSLTHDMTLFPMGVLGTGTLVAFFILIVEVID